MPTSDSAKVEQDKLNEKSFFFFFDIKSLKILNLWRGLHICECDWF